MAGLGADCANAGWRDSAAAPSRVRKRRRSTMWQSPRPVLKEWPGGTFSHPEARSGRPRPRCLCYSLAGRKLTRALMARRIPVIFLFDVAVFCVALPALGADRAPAAPDLSGAWARTTFALEPPRAGQGPLRISQRQGNGAAVYASPLLKPEAQKVVKQRFDTTQAGKPYPTPSSSCWPMVAPLIFRVQEMQLL